MDYAAICAYDFIKRATENLYQSEELEFFTGFEFL